MSRKSELLPVGTAVICRFDGWEWDSYIAEVDEEYTDTPYRVVNIEGFPLWLNPAEVEEIKHDKL